MKMFTFACTAVLSLGTLSSAHAADSTAPPTQVVKYGELDLSRTEGQAALYGRLVSASHSVCREFDPSLSSLNFRLRAYYRACQDKAIADAVARIDRPEFTAYVESKQPHVAAVQVASR